VAGARRLLGIGVDMEVKDDAEGRTVPQRIASRGNSEMVELLLENGADIDSKDRDLGSIC